MADSYRCKLLHLLGWIVHIAYAPALNPNTRILFGVVLGVVGMAGLYWDRWIAPEESREGDKPLVGVRVVDRER